MTNPPDRDGGPAFTCVFHGNARDIKGNPFKLDTPFGKPFSIGVGDAHARCDFMAETLELVSPYLAKLGENDDEAWAVYSRVIRALDLARLDSVAANKAREVQS